MTMISTRAALAVCLYAALTTGAAAESHGGASVDHSAMGHGAMTTPDTVSDAEVAAVIHSVDAEGGVITVTHEPVEALGWPQMTMDLAVSKRVDLGAAPLEQPVTLSLKKGRDNVFRVMEIKPAP